MAVKDRALEEFNELKQLFELPRLYLADFFSDLRHQVNKQLAFRHLNENNEEKKKNLAELWIKMIEKIDFFEMKSTRISLKEPNRIKERLDLIETMLNENNFKNIEELTDKIQTEETNILSQLFQNKTIAFVNSDVDIYRRYRYNSQLIIINDFFISNKSIKKRQTNRQVEKILDDELIKIILMKRKLDSRNFLIEETFQLSDLNELYLAFNEITDIKWNTFNCLTNLRMLNLTGNKLFELKSNVFRSLSNLQLLDLSNNSLHELNESIFANLNQLQKLFLGSNKIKQIVENTFDGLNNLVFLDLSYNKISEINTYAFKRLNSLRTLNLSQNRISNQMNRIELMSKFEGLEKLQEIILFQN